MSQASAKSRARTRPQRREKTSTGPAKRPSIVISYQAKEGVDAYVRRVVGATPMQIVHLERTGVDGSFIKALSKRMEIPSSHMFRVLGVPKATAEAKASAGKMVAGHGGHAAIGMVKLLGIAQEIVANSTASDAKGFDAPFPAPNALGGGFSFWNRMGIRLPGTGVALVQRGSLLSDMTSSKEEVGHPQVACRR